MMLGSDYTSTVLISSVFFFVATTAAVFLAWRPVAQWLGIQEAQYDLVLRKQLLLDIPPRLATVLSIVLIVLVGLLGYLIVKSIVGAILGGVLALFIPAAILQLLRTRRIRRLEDQLVGTIQSLASGVRAGLNLIQAMELVSRDGPDPARQEFGHMLREYEFGVSLEDAMSNAANRIGSSDYRLLFSALLTHRERGGDLGETLDRIADSIREIQRLEDRVETLTAQGRATATALGVFPIIILLMMYFLGIGREAVKELFQEPAGLGLLAVIAGLNLIGFLWIRKIVSVDL
jgi:tight adherence protein B